MNRNSYKMSVKAVHLYRIRIILLAAILSFFCGGVMVFSVSVALLLVAVFSFSLSILIIWLPHLMYKGHYTTIERGLISITKRLIFNCTYYVKLDDIKYITLSATPLQRYFNIFSVYIYTSCGRVCMPNTERLPSQLKRFLK